MKCYEKRTIEVPDCKENNPDDCNRTFHLYLPDIICGGDDGGGGQESRRRLGMNDIIEDDDTIERNESSSENNNIYGNDVDSGDFSPPDLQTIGTLPLVFGIHCLGCTARSIDTFVEHANTHNVVLVLPEGIQNSFNAGDQSSCCGYALANDINDIGFIKHLQSLLSEEYSFVQAADYSYAVGWSNGGFMVMHAASLFRSISPISGHVYDIDPALTKGGTFCVDNICVDAPGEGKGIFLHHGVDDTFVRPTGCCNDPDQPKCCCNIAVGDICVPVEDVARNWALEVNGCETEVIEEDDYDGEDESTNTENEGNKGDDEDDVERALAEVTEVKFVTSHSNPDEGIECTTTTGTDCKANTTICLHHSGHFNSPSFTEAFPFAKEVIDFFSRDACEINDGKWNETSATCVCTEDHGGTFCLDDAVAVEDHVVVDAETNTEAKTEEEDITEPTLSIHQVENDYEVDLVGTSSSTTTTTTISHKGVFGFSLLMMAVFYVVRKRNKMNRKKNDGGYTHVMDRDMEEATELVSTRGFRTN